ncbi:hypothetical protein C8Q79DRAFT_16204 [Trametes meyenii]|nr:hypothetical protein C8Q79DRAFT_16204 [Trametes meyenii]
MDGWLYDYRIFSFVITLGSEISVFVQSMKTLEVRDQVKGVSLTYARFAISTAVLTIIPLVVILLRECINRPLKIKYELATIPILSVLWLAVGGVALSFSRTTFGGIACDAIDDAATQTVCTYASPISTFSFVPGGVMLAYGLVVLFVAGCSQRGGKSIWDGSVRGPRVGEVAL